MQESCGFGFVLHREPVAAGAQSFLITPIALNGRRKTDKLDACALAACAFPAGSTATARNSPPSRIPSQTEQRQREGTRCREEFLADAIRRLTNRGHSQISEYCHDPLPHRWWGPRNWPKLAALDPWVLVLAKLRDLIMALEAQLAELLTELLARVKDEVTPMGLGGLDLLTLDGEVCDWHRFSNRKQVGSYTGCCPGEHSSGNQRRVGGIDRMGNGRVRALLVEAVWRFLHWQPNWQAALKMKTKPGAGTAMKKKTVIAPELGNWPSTCGAGAPVVAPWKNSAGCQPNL